MYTIYGVDIINTIPLDSKVKIKLKHDEKIYKGKIIRNDDNCMGIDFPTELGGTYFTKECIEYIKIYGDDLFMGEPICKGRGFNCNLDCKQKDTCNQYINNKIDFDKIKVQSLTDETHKLKQDNELAMIGRQEALDLRDRYNLSNELLKQGLLLGVSVEEMEYILNKVKNSDIDIDYNRPLEVFLTYKDLEKRVNNSLKL